MRITSILLHNDNHKGIYLSVCIEETLKCLIPSIQKFKSAILISLTILAIGIRYNKKKFGIGLGLPCLFLEIGVLNGKEEDRNDNEKETKN